MKTSYVLLLVCLNTALFGTPPTVSNVSFAQRTDGSKIIDVFYDLRDEDSAHCQVIVSLSDNNGLTYDILPNPGLLLGDIGNAVTPGLSKHIMWFAEYEDTFYLGENYKFMVTAIDGPPSQPDDFVILLGRTFVMGRTSGTGDVDELPPHNVTLSSFAVCKHETTQQEWEVIMGSNPAYGYGVGPNHPVYNVSWYDILKYCNLRSISEGYTPVYSINGSTNPNDWGEIPTEADPVWDSAECSWSADGYRLPTDAEWEYAARGCRNDPDYLYAGSNNLVVVAWCSGNNSPYGTKDVGQKTPNSMGLYDLSGNVWEYCWDWQGIFNGTAETNPNGPATGIYRIARGGYWLSEPQQCRVYERSGYWSYHRTFWMGFRLAKSIPPDHAY